MTENHILCLVEEFIFGGHGTINLLTIERSEIRLLKNEILLSTDSHLSYPIFFCKDEDIYVYPESGVSGELSIYKFNRVNRKLIKCRQLIKEPLIDSTIFDGDTVKYLIATKKSDSAFKHAYLYKSIDGGESFVQIGKNPVVQNIESSRPGGNFFIVNGDIYRPAQNCNGRYGRSLKIMKVETFEPYIEYELMDIKPTWFKYSLRLHTLNFHSSGFAVIDACGYVYPVLGRILCPLYDILLKFKGINYYK